MPGASKKKEAAMAELEASHQSALQDRWEMAGADSPTAFPAHVSTPALIHRLMHQLMDRGASM